MALMRDLAEEVGGLTAWGKGLGSLIGNPQLPGARGQQFKGTNPTAHKLPSAKACSTQHTHVQLKLHDGAAQVNDALQQA